MDKDPNNDPFSVENLLERSPFDISTARDNVKRGCRRCNGKGYLTFNTPIGSVSFRKGAPVNVERQYCTCVMKNLKKQFKEE
tara:strand:+ start:245 stop:490 length:246 start_codon:yes stop_codon:yes gene_type:complete